MILQKLIKYPAGKMVHLPLKNIIAIVFEVACSSSIVDRREKIILHLNKIFIGLSSAGPVTCEPGSSSSQLTKEGRRKCLEPWW